MLICIRVLQKLLSPYSLSFAENLAHLHFLFPLLQHIHESGNYFLHTYIWCLGSLHTVCVAGTLHTVCAAGALHTVCVAGVLHTVCW